MKKKELFIPKSVLNALVDDISEYMQNNVGRLLILEIFEEIPWENRPEMLRLFSAFYNVEMMNFFHLIMQEYGNEFMSETHRALQKYRMAGQNVACPDFIKVIFYKAFVTRTRHTGKVKLNIISVSEYGKFVIESFQLSFGYEGIYGYSIIEDLSAEEFKKENFASLKEISYPECQYLLQEAFEFNRKNMKIPARGKFLYKKYLDIENSLPSSDIKDLIINVSANLTPRQVVNTFFNALVCRDYTYLLSICEAEFDIRNPEKSPFIKPFKSVLRTGAFMVEAKVNNLEGCNNLIEAKTHIFSIFEGKVYKYDYIFGLKKNDQKKWLINKIEKTKQIKLGEKSKLNPLNMQVNCRTYEITDLEPLFDALDSLDNLYELGELPYGVHMRINTSDDSFSKGISCLNGVMADMVINGDEFVLICQEMQDLEMLNKFLTIECQTGLILRGIYKLPLSIAYRYLSGQYSAFEDSLLENEELVIFNDNLRFITVRYLIKEPEPVKNFLGKIKAVSYEINNEARVYYQVTNKELKTIFFAEYIINDIWLTISAFGDSDISIAREKIEKTLCDYLQFEGLEMKEEGIFEILTPEIKSQYPQLERNLKEIYLNKWYYTKCPILKGMSPFEASKSEEGIKLIWEWLKLMKYRNNKSHNILQNGSVQLREYINRISF